jgi:hypothetical protein
VWRACALFIAKNLTRLNGEGPQRGEPLTEIVKGAGTKWVFGALACGPPRWRGRPGARSRWLRRPGPAQRAQPRRSPRRAARQAGPRAIMARTAVRDSKGAPNAPPPPPQPGRVLQGAARRAAQVRAAAARAHGRRRAGIGYAPEGAADHARLPGAAVQEVQGGRPGGVRRARRADRARRARCRDMCRAEGRPAPAPGRVRGRVTDRRSGDAHASPCGGQRASASDGAARCRPAISTGRSPRAQPPARAAPE